MDSMAFDDEMEDSDERPVYSRGSDWVHAIRPAMLSEGETKGSFRDLSQFANWSLSSCKVDGDGFGIHELLADNADQYWQSDGPQPHCVTVEFARKTDISFLALYLDYKSDESYTPNKHMRVIGPARSRFQPEGMPKYYCDYCDAFLTHDSPSVRKTHNGGRKHKDSVRGYYQKWMEDQAQKLVDATAKAFAQGRGVGPRPGPGGPPMGFPGMGMGRGGPPMHGMPPMGMPPGMGRGMPGFPPFGPPGMPPFMMGGPRPPMMGGPPRPGPPR